MTRNGSSSSAGDYHAVGKMGITHEIMRGSIVYAIDMTFTYADTGHRVRKWCVSPTRDMLKGWLDRTDGLVRRHIAVETTTGML